MVGWSLDLCTTFLLIQEYVGCGGHTNSTAWQHGAAWISQQIQGAKLLINIALSTTQTNVVPSGELTVRNGKSPFLMGKSTISMAIFNSFLLVHQRVFANIGIWHWHDMTWYPYMHLHLPTPKNWCVFPWFLPLANQKNNLQNGMFGRQALAKAPIEK